MNKKKLQILISTILSLVLLLSAIPNLALPVFAEILDGKTDLEEFSEDVMELIRTEYCSDTAMSFYGSAGGEVVSETADPEYETARLIVKSKKKIDPLNAVSVVDGYNDLHILQFATPLDAQKACEYYLTLDSVEYAQPDRIVTATEIEEPMPATDKTIEEIIAERPDLAGPGEVVGINALREHLALQNVSYTGKIEVAVIDTGVESTHELLKHCVEPTGKNFSDDGDENSSEDNEGHGTHVAGIIAVNSLSNVKIKPYKVLSSEGQGTDLQIVLGIESAIADGVDIINMSLGGRFYSESMHEAVKKAYNLGIPVVVAAGNDFTNIDKITYSPASFPECITVMAHGSDCRGNPGSNFGTLCDLAAPGLEILSSYLDNKYAYLSGTSMATPIVSAAVTYVLLENPEMNSDQIVEHLLKYALSNGESRICLYMEYITRDLPELSPPVFSVEGGEFDETFELTLSSVDEGVTIYYNRSEMNPNFYRIYEEPLTIKYDTTIIAYAYKKGTITSETIVNSYTRVFPDEDSKYIMDEDGTIVEYLGHDTELIVPDEIQGIKVKKIGREAFYDNVTLESIVLPDAVTVIDSQAFYSNDNLAYIRALGVTDIGSSGFIGCSSLEVFDGNNVTTIGGYAFKGCSSLQYFDFSKVTFIDSCAFKEATGVHSLISDTLTEINGQVFEDSDITVVDVPYVTTIGGDAFAGCTKLERVNIPSVTSLGNYAFAGCTALPEIKADNLTRAGVYAFYNCSLVEEFDFPNLSSLGTGTSTTSTSAVFKDCTSLKRVNLPKATAFAGHCFVNCTSLVDIVAPQVTLLGNCAFMGCTSLSNIDFPRVTDMGRDVFKNCENVTELDLPSLKSIVKYAFLSDHYIERLIVPNVETIYDLPAGAKVAIGSKATMIKDPDDLSCGEDITIYGTRKTYANQWATENEIKFINITQETAIINNVPLDITKSESPILYADVIGFNRTYQWYTNTVEDNLTGTAIEGATNATLDTSLYPKAPYYYCVITSTDTGCEPVEIRTGCTTPYIIEPMSSQIRFGVNEDGSYAGTFDIRSRAKISDEFFKKYVGATNEEAIEKIDKIGFVCTINNIYEFDAVDARAAAMGEIVDGYLDVPVSHIQDADGYYMFTCTVTGLTEQEQQDESFRAYAYICVDGVWHFFPDVSDTGSFYDLLFKYYPIAAEQKGWPDWDNRIKEY